jgi:hypothetical protein
MGATLMRHGLNGRKPAGFADASLSCWKREAASNIGVFSQKAARTGFQENIAS